MRLRQIALVSENFLAVRDALFALLGLDDGHVDPKIDQFGLQNVVMTLGDTFLEVVSPIREGTTAGRLLEKRNGDGGYMVIVQVDDLKKERERIEKTDIRTVFSADTGRAAAIHLHPLDVPGAIASLDQMKPPQAWYWAGPDWDQRVARHVGDIRAAEIQCDNVSKVSQNWAEAYGVAVDHSAGVPSLKFKRSEVRFVAINDGRGPGLRAIDIEIIDKDALFAAAQQLGLERYGNTVNVCGTDINLI